MEPAARGIPTVWAEVATAAALAAMGGVAIWDSLRLGAGWSADGPQTGYFPFWIGLFLVAASLGTMVKALRSRTEAGLFVSWPQLRLVLSVLIPNTVFVAAIPFLGIYLPAAGLVVWFMTILGGFAWWRAVLAGIATAVVAYVVFELWFLVALPKGPVEEWLGL